MYKIIYNNVPKKLYLKYWLKNNIRIFKLYIKIKKYTNNSLVVDKGYYYIGINV